MEMKFRSLPSVNKVLSDDRLSPYVKKYPYDLLVDVVRRCLERERASIAAGKSGASFDNVICSVLETMQSLERLSLRRVINAAGVIIHTNLGRAPLSAESLDSMEEASCGYSNLEFNLENGTRGSRHVHVEGLLCQLSGAEAAMVVNNNASGVMLALTAIARRKEVIISRGQAVEIGGSFRIPDVMYQSGARLVEVGTTNCTYARDFEQAITPRTAAMIRVHSSNFRMLGFVSEVTLEELVDIGNQNDIVVLDDLGSGCFLDTTVFGLEPEPMVQQSVAGGAALTFFSGDKLVGGPQAGIVVGKKLFIDKLKKHPLARVVRTDKTRLAALAATLQHYLKGEAVEKIPVWRMISASLDDIERRALLWASILKGRSVIVPGETMVGGGSLPGSSLPTKLVAIMGGTVKGSSAQAVARRLRHCEIPVIGRISENMLLLDPRTVLPEEDDIVLEALRDIAAPEK
jgi:L-seryl-tRNA(Ser) seleniumtransferase